MKFWFEAFKDRSDEYRWALRVASTIPGADKTLALATQGRKEKADCIRDIEDIRTAVQSATIIFRKED